MEITYQVLLDSIPSLQLLAGTAMKAAASLRLSRLITAVDNEVAPFWEQHAVLALRCGGVLVAGSTSYKIPDEGQPEYVGEFEEMLKATVELPLSPLPIAVLDDVNITPLQMKRVSVFFED